MFVRNHTREIWFSFSITVLARHKSVLLFKAFLYFFLNFLEIKVFFDLL